MPKETRDAVVSVRLSAEEQERLKQLAVEEGASSVSELIRRHMRLSAEAPLPLGETAASTPSMAASIADHGPFWTGPAGAVADGATLTVTVSDAWEDA